MFQSFHYLARRIVTDINIVLDKYLPRKENIVGARGNCVQI